MTIPNWVYEWIGCCMLLWAALVYSAYKNDPDIPYIYITVCAVVGIGNITFPYLNSLIAEKPNDS